MKKVFIKYNPYKIETEFTVDGELLKENSKIGEKIWGTSEEKSEEENRLQVWVEELPQLLIDEYNDNDFDITFHGTILDYEDLEETFKQAGEKLTVKLTHIMAKETSDKVKLIDSLHEKIQNGPFDELKGDEVDTSFEDAKSSDFKVCVVATMSAGKSTLINALLQEKLMPSAQEACTAKITEIKDNDADVWRAEAYDEAGQLLETHERLDSQIMDTLNKNEKITKIKVTGNIPFVKADETSLVLVDTPGRNNARNSDHRKIQEEYLGSSSKTLILYIMEGTYGSDDDNLQLESVKESMSVGGKQSKDRFIFVLNKMDARKKEDGDTDQMLDRIRAYLSQKGIQNPNLFPVAALPALNIRMIQNGVYVDEDTLDETEVKVKKLNRNENLHLEDFASLPLSARTYIVNNLRSAEAAGNVQEQALIHTGIPSVEAAISQYVEKYAKTAKIKNIVDTFIHRLDSAESEEKTKKELVSRTEECEKIVKQIEKIKTGIDDVKEAAKFKNAVDDAVRKVNKDAEQVVNSIVEKFQTEMGGKILSFRGRDLTVEEAQAEVQRLEKYAKALEPKFQAELDKLIHENLVNTGNVLISGYQKKLASLTETLGEGALKIVIDPLKIMKGSMPLANGAAITRFVQTKDVEDGDEWVENTDKKWYKPWTWFDEDGYFRTKYKTVEYIDAGKMAEDFLRPVQKIIFDDGENAIKQAIRQSEKISKEFGQEFQRLNNLLKKKMDEFESYVSDRGKVEARKKEIEEKLQWLEDIKQEMEAILEI